MGGTCQRSLASLYFFIVLVNFFLLSVEPNFFLVAIFIGGCSLFIANIRPYKKKYMSIIDSLILANMALLSAAIDRNKYASRFFQVIIGVSVLLPALGLFSFVIFKRFKKPLKRVFVKIKERFPQVKLRWCCSEHKDDGVRNDQEEQGNPVNGHDDDIQLPDRIVHPEAYTLEEDQTLA